MALDTPTIERLITDRTEALHLEATEAIASVSDKQRRLLTEIAVLRHLAKGGEQIAEFNATNSEPWHHQFRAATRQELRRVFRNGRAERFQRAFVAKDNRAVPSFPRGDAPTMPLDGFVVAPDRVPGALLVKTGIVDAEELEGLNGDQIGRLVTKHDVIPSVKMLFEAASPIGPKQGRLLRVNHPTPEQRSRYPDATPTADGAIGSILYVHGTAAGGGESDDLAVSVYDGLYDILRKTDHAESSYDREIDALSECKQRLESIRDRLDDGYRVTETAETKMRLWDDAEATIARVGVILGAAIAPPKVAARSLVAEAGEQRTRTGKPNVSPAMAKMTAALNRIRDRFTEIRGKGGFNAEDRIILRERLRKNEGTLLDTRRDVAALATPGTDRFEARRALELRVKELQSVRERPLSAFANAMARQIQMLEPANERAFAEQLGRLDAIGKIQGLRTSAERIRANKARDRRIDCAREAATARKVLDAFAAAPSPGLTVRVDAEHVMEELGSRWGAVIDLLERHAVEPPDDPVAFEEQLEDMLDTLGTENAAQALVSWLPEEVPYEEPFVLTRK